MGTEPFRPYSTEHPRRLATLPLPPPSSTSFSRPEPLSPTVKHSHISLPSLSSSSFPAASPTTSKRHIPISPSSPVVNNNILAISPFSSFIKTHWDHSQAPSDISVAAASPPLIQKSTGPSIFTYADAVKRVNKSPASSDLPSLDGSVNSIKSVGSPHSSSDSHVFS